MPSRDSNSDYSGAKNRCQTIRRLGSKLFPKINLRWRREVLLHECLSLIYPPQELAFLVRNNTRRLVVTDIAPHVEIGLLGKYVPYAEKLKLG